MSKQKNETKRERIGSTTKSSLGLLKWVVLTIVLAISLIAVTLLGLSAPVQTNPDKSESKITASTSDGSKESWELVSGVGSTCDEAYEKAIENCKNKGGTEWKIIGPCLDTSDGKKSQKVTCKIVESSSY